MARKQRTAKKTLLGWQISVSDEKMLPFADSFQMLGAVMDFSETSTGVISVKNKQFRLDDISALVDSIVAKDDAPMSQLETLKGRLLYASGHTFGKCTQLAIHLISKSVKGGKVEKLIRSCGRFFALKTFGGCSPKEGLILDGTTASPCFYGWCLRRRRH